MKKTRAKICLFAIILSLLFVVCKNAVFGTLRGPSQGDALLQSVNSPDSTKTVQVYRHSGGATTCWSTICSVSGKGILDRNVFLLYHATDAEVIWLDNDRIWINAVICGEECIWWYDSPQQENGLVLDISGEWYSNGSLGGIGRDENGKPYLHRWWKDEAAR